MPFTKEHMQNERRIAPQFFTCQNFLDFIIYALAAIRPVLEAGAHNSIRFKLRFLLLYVTLKQYVGNNIVVYLLNICMAWLIKNMC